MAAVVCVATLVAAGPPAAAAAPPSGYHACSRGGVLKLAAADGTCAGHTGPVRIDARGATGAPGIAGERGARGPAGPAGPTGARGPTGMSGAQGLTGSRGAAGAAGASGPAGPNGAEGTSGVGSAHYDYADTTYFPAADSFQTLATVPNLPAGSYLLMAKLVLVDDSQANPSAIEYVTTCRLAAQSSSDEVQTLMAGGDGGNPSETTVALEVADTFTSAGPATVQCDNGNEDVYARNVKVIAIPLTHRSVSIG